jgi:tRNA(Ile)-lysidine synthetase-like protein
MTTDALLDSLRAALARHHLLQPGKLVVAAVSGGPDSLCLLHLLVRLREAGGPTVHVAHLDHGFRGAQSAAEAQFVAQAARAWGLPATIEHADVPAYAAATGQNRQAAARAARYAFLGRVAQDTGAVAVLVAHHADDQAETVLLHLLHGAGPAGLRGMREALPWPEWCPATEAAPAAAPGPLLLRPLLDVRRAAIEAYCAAHGLEPRHDPSNASPAYMRNRLRADLLPALAAYNPHIVAALGRTARICADDYAYMQRQLDAAWPDLADERPGALLLRAAPWAALHPALQRYALRRAAALLGGAGELSYEQVEAAREAAAQGVGHQHTLAHNISLRVEHHGLLLRAADAPPTAAASDALPQLHTDDVPLAVPGVVPFSPTWCAEAGSGTPPALPDDPPWRWWVVLDAERLDGPLRLRRRRPGDRFRPAGGQGSRRLQDFFVDSKLPREFRAAWPLLATPTSIVWVAGLRADARFLASGPSPLTVWVVLQRRIACTMTSSES